MGPVGIPTRRSHLRGFPHSSRSTSWLVSLCIRLSEKPCQSNMCNVRTFGGGHRWTGNGIADEH